MKEKKFLFLLAGLLILLVGVFFFQKMDKKDLKTAITTSPNAQSTLSFSPSSKSASIGGSFSLEAKINPGGDNKISGASLGINFPVDGIECETITGGTGLTVFTQGAISNTNGTASIEVGASPSSPITASTTIAVLTCKGKTAGSHSISFDETTTSAYATGETGSVIKSTSPAIISVSASTATPTLKISFIESETDTTELTTAVQDETKAARYQLTGYDKDKYDWFFKFSLPITVDGSTITTETWSQMPDDGLPESADLKTAFKFSTTTTGDFYADIKIVAQGAGSSGTAVYSSQTNHVDITASESTTIVNGACGSSNGQSYSSAPSSGLCTLGTASAVSGSGPWTWTCSGSGGGISINCSANLMSSSTTYTYSPTTSVIPVTEYTYSYTSKVAPASGPVTNVILLLSISAAITLGVWVVMKKIKG